VPGGAAGIADAVPPIHSHRSSIYLGREQEFREHDRVAPLREIVFEFLEVDLDWRMGAASIEAGFNRSSQKPAASMTRGFVNCTGNIAFLFHRT
jgi:hypothetical protein